MEQPVVDHAGVTAPAVSCERLRKAYGSVIAVADVTLTVHRGECFGLLGPNGAGKTTTIEILEGLLTPDSGEVEVLGLRWGHHEAALRQRLGIQLQETQLADKLTVEETLRLFRSFYTRGRAVDDLLQMVELESKRTSRVGKLSGGQKQRLSLACALAGDPDLLFLDEPTTGLDPHSRRQPRWSSGRDHGSDPKMQALWEILYNAQAELVVTGHEHNYERFAPMDKNGEKVKAGLQQIVVGTGGASLDGFDDILSASQVRNSDTHGVLKLTLGPGKYTWRFVPVAGKTFTDKGSIACH